MKEAVGAFIFALVVSCILNSLGVQYQPYPYPVGLNGVSEGGLGVKRGEGNIPEVNYTDGDRPTKFITKVDAGGEDRDAEWPLGANN